MDQWDEEKLRNVVLSKHGNPRTTTDVRLWNFHYSVLNLTSSYRLFANSLLKLSRRKSLDGSGNAQTAMLVNTDTHFRQDSYSNLKRRQSVKQPRLILSQ